MPTEFGWVSSVTRAIRGYGSDPFSTYKPGATSLFVGGLRCSSACTFCATTNVVHAPERLPWGLQPPALAPPDSLWYGYRAMLAPHTAVDAAQHWGCSQILFGINEPTVTIEWTLEVAVEAKRRGIDVLVETNGFTSPAVIVDHLADVVDAVDVGVKGSADPEFYDRWTRSAGAVPHVQAALKVWRQLGVHVLVTDVLAAPHMQDPVTFRRSARDLYGWLVDNLGPLTPVLLAPMMRPIPMNAFTSIHEPLARPGEESAVGERLAEAGDIAREVGLLYAYEKKPVRQEISCHSCGHALLTFREHCGAGLTSIGRPISECVMVDEFCPWWSHDQYVTDGRCDHCGAAVPIVTLSVQELQRQREVVRAATVSLTPPIAPSTRVAGS